MRNFKLCAVPLERVKLGLGDIRGSPSSPSGSMLSLCYVCTKIPQCGCVGVWMRRAAPRKSPPPTPYHHMLLRASILCTKEQWPPSGPWSPCQGGRGCARRDAPDTWYKVLDTHPHTHPPAAPAPERYAQANLVHVQPIRPADLAGANKRRCAERASDPSDPVGLFARTRFPTRLRNSVVVTNHMLASLALAGLSLAPTQPTNHGGAQPLISLVGRRGTRPKKPCGLTGRVLLSTPPRSPLSGKAGRGHGSAGRIRSEAAQSPVRGPHSRFLTKATPPGPAWGIFVSQQLGVRGGGVAMPC